MTQIRARVASSVLAAATIFSTVALAAPASAAPDKPANPSTQVLCGYIPPNRDSTIGDFSTADGAIIRNGPSTSCRPDGVGYPGHRADYFCYVSGDGGTWTYLRDISTGKQGWVRDDLLTGNGSYVHC
jgi:hypothetical protein